jgi:hypothetical protein
MTKTAPIGSPSLDNESASLAADIAALVERVRPSVASCANAALMLLHRRVGQLIDDRVLKRQCADYGKRIVASVSRQANTRFGRGFDEKTLRRMMQFAREFPDEQIVASLMRQLNWTRILELLPHKSDEACQFYAQQAVDQRLSVRELRGIICTETSREQIELEIAAGSFEGVLFA